MRFFSSYEKGAWMRRSRAALRNIVGFALVLGWGTGGAHAGVKAVSSYFPAAGAAGDVVATNDGHVIVSLTALNRDQLAGIQIFSKSAGYQNPCATRFNTPGIVQVFGLALFPAGPYQMSKASVAAAVEAQGAQFFRVVNPNTCVVDNEINVPQPPVSAAVNAPGTFAVAVTPPGRPEFAFVANEYGILPKYDFGGSGTVGIVKVQRDSNGGFSSNTRLILPNPYIFVRGANTLPGVTVSRDGKRLYIVHENAQGQCGFFPCNNPTNSSNPSLVSDKCVNEFPTSDKKSNNGVLTIIDVDRAISGWGQFSIIKTIAAGCSPVRVVESLDGKTIWVAARGGSPTDPAKGRILAFDVAKLLSKWMGVSDQALIGDWYSGGTQPVGMALLDNGRLLAVANSNRFTDGQSGDTNVAFLDVSNIADPSLLTACKSKTISDFPRGVTVGGDDATVYVANFGGCDNNTCAKPTPGKLQVITTAGDASSSCTQVE